MDTTDPKTAVKAPAKATTAAAAAEVTSEVTAKAAVVAAAAEVTPEVTADVVARRFITTTEDAEPFIPAPKRLPQLNARTLAEQKAGVEATAQYASPAE
jgi:hypothetical protein